MVVLDTAQRRRMNLLRWVGFGAAVVLAAAAVGAGAEPHVNPAAGIPVLGLLAGAPTVALACALAGMGALVLAWLSLGRFATVSGEPLASPSDLRRTVALWAAPLALAPPLFSRDVYSYLAQGKMAALGADPYSSGAAAVLGPGGQLLADVSPVWQHTPSPYGPLFLSLARGIAAVTGNAEMVAIWLHRLPALAGLALVAWALPRLAERCGIPGSAALWLGVANPLVLWHLVAGVHNDSLMLGLMVAGMEVAAGALAGKGVPRRGEIASAAAGAVLVSLGAAVKVTALVGLVFVGVVLARRLGGRVVHLVLAASATAAIACAVLGGVSAASGLGLGWLGSLGISGLVNSWMAPTNELGFLAGGVGTVLGFGDITQAAIGVAKVLGAACAGVLGVRFTWQSFRGLRSPLYGFALLCAALVVFGPSVQPWYLLWAVIPLAAAAPAGKVRAVAVVTSAAAAVILPPTGGSFSGHVTGLVLAYLVAIVVVFATYVTLYVTLRPRPDHGAVIPDVAS